MTREYMISVLWRTLDEPLHQFDDGSEAMFTKCIKLERMEGKIEVYDTRTNWYNIMPTDLIRYAYENSFEDLSDTLALDTIIQRPKQNKLTKDVQTEGKKKYNKLIQKGTLTIDQIKEKYEQQQVTDNKLNLIE